MMIDIPTYHGIPNVTPWQLATPAGFGGLTGQYGQGIGGGPGYSQLNGILTQLALSPLAVACLAAQSAFASALGQYGQPTSGGALAQPLAGQLAGWQGLGLSPFVSPLIGSLALPGGLAGLPGPYGQQPYGLQGIGGWLGHPQLGGGIAQLGFGQLPLAAALAPQSVFGGAISPVLAGLSGGAFGQRGPWSGVASQLPFATAPQMAYAG